MSFVADTLNSMTVAEYERWLEGQSEKKERQEHVGAKTGRMSCADPNLSTLPKTNGSA